jgi:hypothetical protein
MQYDQLRASWTVPAPCEAAAPGAQHAVQLDQFRTLERLPGAISPACYRVGYACPGCDRLHSGLATQGILDWEPLQGMWPVFHDLMIGRENWEPVQSRWVDGLIRGEWPLAGWCTLRRHVVGLWPTQLRAIEPREGGTHFLVCFDCPACQALEVETMDAARLTYGLF